MSFYERIHSFIVSLARDLNALILNAFWFCCCCSSSFVWSSPTSRHSQCLSHSFAHIVANSLRFCFCALTMLTFSLYAIVKLPYNTNFMCAVFVSAFRFAWQNGKFECIRREYHHRHQPPAAPTDDNKYALCCVRLVLDVFSRIRATQRLTVRTAKITFAELRKR